jgi:hypothetical protein
MLDEELYTKPRTQFLARIRNPNDDKALAAASGKSADHAAQEGGHR